MIYMQRVHQDFEFVGAILKNVVTNFVGATVNNSTYTVDANKANKTWC